MSREVLKMALEALGKAKRQIVHANVAPHGCIGEAITAIKETLVTKDVSLPEQEPVATTASDHIKNEMGYCQFHANVPNDTKLYTSPPQREWVGLTDEAYMDLAHRIASKYTHRTDPTFTAYTFLPHTLEQFVRSIEDELKEKNT